MISKKDITSTIDVANEGYRKCWEVLLWFKGENSAPISIQDALEFQGSLTQILFNIEKKRREIKHEEQSLIGRKGLVPRKYFIQRLNNLSEYCKALETTSNIGYELGDSFAWVFYRSSRELLKAHYQLNSSKIQTSLGGFGELQFIKNVHSIKGYFVLYHGITTFLTIGDFSLIDLRQRKAITTGEIKTIKKTGRMMNLSVVIYHAQKVWPKENLETESRKIINLYSELPNKHRQRNIRQFEKAMSVIQKEINADKIENIVIQADSYQNSVERLFRETKCYTVNYVQASDGLVFVGHKVRRSRLSTVTLTSGHDTFVKDFDRNRRQLTGMIKPSEHRNELVVSWLFYSPVKNVLVRKLPYGTKPILWWDISSSAAYSIVFQRFVVLTIYNRGYLADKLAKAGYNIEYDKEAGDFILSVVIDNKIVGINSFIRLCNTVQQYLMTDDAIIKLLNEAVERIENLNKPSTWSVDIELLLE